MLASQEHLDRDELGTLYSIARVLNSTLELDEVLQLVMDRVIGFVDADRGFLMLVDRETSLLAFNIARNNRERSLEKAEFEQMSLSTVNQVVSTRKAVTDADLFDPTQSMQIYGIRSIMCAPLVVRNVCIGAVYVDRRTTMDIFTLKHRALLLAFCHQAAIAIDNARLFADLNPESPAGSREALPESVSYPTSSRSERTASHYAGRARAWHDRTPFRGLSYSRARGPGLSEYIYLLITGYARNADWPSACGR
jgi:transcriptional regulator with GAF, ATPase, and Fis domain